MSVQEMPYRIGTLDFIRAYGITMRPYLMFISGITGISGMAFAASVDATAALLIAIASFLSYGFGQALTDCFQTDTDAISSPYRPLTQGKVSMPSILAVSIIGLTVCVGILASFDPRIIILGVLAGLGLATYTPFKRRWWGGPWYNAWIVGVLFLIGYLAGMAQHPGKIPGGLYWILGSAFFGYANFVLAGYFKDIDADRATGYMTFPVVFGRRGAAFACDGLAALAVICALGGYNMIVHDKIIPIITLYLSAAILAAGTAITITAQILLHRVRTDAEAHRAISLTVHAYILLLTSIAIVLHAEWALALCVWYAAFVVVLNLRPSRAQV